VRDAIIVVLLVVPLVIRVQKIEILIPQAVPVDAACHKSGSTGNVTCLSAQTAF